MVNPVKEFVMGLGVVSTVVLVAATFVGIIAGLVIIIPILIALFLPVLIAGIIAAMVVAILGCVWYIGHAVGVNGN